MRFNPLVFGMVSEIGEGCDVRQALEELEEMKSAALTYAKNSPGWPKDPTDIGLYVNIFGHNNVNSLFIHILDLTVTGPSFAVSWLSEGSAYGFPFEPYHLIVGACLLECPQALVELAVPFHA